MEVHITDNTIVMLIDKALYPEDVLYKCFYWYTNTFIIDIEHYNEDFFSVRLQQKHGSIEAEKINEKIKRDLLDFKLRDIVTKETKTIRELIVAKAFAHYDLDDSPNTEVSDPVGFNPLLNS